MRLISKLLLAQRTMDVSDPDGKRTITFTIKSGVPEFSNWDVSLTQQGEQIQVNLRDEGSSTFNEKSFEDVRKKLMARVDAIRPEIVALKKFPHLKVEQILSNMRSQIVACFAEIDPPKQKPWWKGTK
jgi:hypothetical protein